MTAETEAVGQLAIVAKLSGAKSRYKKQVLEVRDQLLLILAGFCGDFILTMKKARHGTNEGFRVRSVYANKIIITFKSQGTLVLELVLTVPNGYTGKAVAKKVGWLKEAEVIREPVGIASESVVMASTNPRPTQEVSEVLVPDGESRSVETSDEKEVPGVAVNEVIETVQEETPAPAPNVCTAHVPAEEIPLVTKPKIGPKDRDCLVLAVIAVVSASSKAFITKAELVRAILSCLGQSSPIYAGHFVKTMLAAGYILRFEENFILFPEAFMLAGVPIPVPSIERKGRDISKGDPMYWDLLEERVQKSQELEVALVAVGKFEKALLAEQTKLKREQRALAKMDKVFGKK